MEVVHQTRDLFLLWGWVKTYYYHILGEELSINQLYFRVPSGHQGFDPQPCGLHRPCCFSPWCRNSPHLAPPPSPRAWVRLSAARPWWVSSLVAGKSRNPGFFMVKKGKIKDNHRQWWVLVHCNVWLLQGRCLITMGYHRGIKGVLQD